MKNWEQVLRDDDREMELMNAQTALRMRSVIVSAASAAVASPAVWPMRLALAAFACLVLMLSTLGTQRPIDVAPDRSLPVAGTERRQVQFATPGGTRIIWEINPNFTLGDTLP